MSLSSSPQEIHISTREALKRYLGPARALMQLAKDVQAVKRNHKNLQAKLTSVAQKDADRHKKLYGQLKNVTKRHRDQIIGLCDVIEIMAAQLYDHGGSEQAYETPQ